MNFVHLCEKIGFVFMDFSVSFFCFLFHWFLNLSSLFLLLTLGLIYSSYSSFLRWKLGPFTWNLSAFLIQEINAINFSVITPSVVSHTSSFSSYSKYFLIFLVISYLTHGLLKSTLLISKYLRILHTFCGFLV